MDTLDALLREARPLPGHRPWPRYAVTADQWRAAGALPARGDCTLVSLWGQGAPLTPAVHLALHEEARGRLVVLSLDCPAGRFPSLAAACPPAARLERAVHDLFGLAPQGAPDARPWLDHGRWGISAPLGAREPAARRPANDYAFLPAEGESLHQIPVGPVHAGIIEPGHFRFTANGETVVRLEERLGYVHKGIDGLLAGAGLAQAARLAGRVSGDSTVAYALAFAQAVEAASGAAVAPRAVWLRALMAELERLANHFGDIGAVCNDAAFAIMHANWSMLREQVLRAAAACFGHRLMMDCIVPGGVAGDLDAAGATRLRELVAALRPRFLELVDVNDNSPSLLERTVGTGILKPELARRFGAGGFVGRASRREMDARKRPGYAPYDELAFEMPVLNSGDVNARLWVRVQEVRHSLALIEQLLASLPPGPLPPATPIAVSAPAEGAALVEGFRGDVFAWVRLEAGGRVARCHLRDPSWFQWPLLEAVIEGNIVADFPLCNKSFNCSYSGHDL
ncbi:MAG: NADH-quinone oxidoreductase subunit C [Candidatus Lambdaproteobacteria bacterium]|nr:NADH-quinone oxidoreductase subunit C [Candidatus Lambdaproteobacteria bacterium]